MNPESGPGSFSAERVTPEFLKVKSGEVVKSDADPERKAFIRASDLFEDLGDRAKISRPLFERLLSTIRTSKSPQTLGLILGVVRRAFEHNPNGILMTVKDLALNEIRVPEAQTGFADRAAVPVSTQEDDEDEEITRLFTSADREAVLAALKTAKSEALSFEGAKLKEDAADEPTRVITNAELKDGFSGVRKEPSPKVPLADDPEGETRFMTLEDKAPEERTVMVLSADQFDEGVRAAETASTGVAAADSGRLTAILDKAIAERIEKGSLNDSTPIRTRPAPPKEAYRRSHPSKAETPVSAVVRTEKHGKVQTGSGAGTDDGDQRVEYFERDASLEAIVEAQRRRAEEAERNQGKGFFDLSSKRD